MTAPIMVAKSPKAMVREVAPPFRDDTSTSALSRSRAGTPAYLNTLVTIILATNGSKLALVSAICFSFRPWRNLRRNPRQPSHSIRPSLRWIYHITNLWLLLYVSTLACWLMGRRT